MKGQISRTKTKPINPKVIITQVNTVDDVVGCMFVMSCVIHENPNTSTAIVKPFCQNKNIQSMSTKITNK